MRMLGIAIAAGAAERNRSMTLQELLVKYNVPAEGITEINQTVDTLIDNKAGTYKKDLAEANKKLEAVQTELTPFKEAARNKKLLELMPKTANKELTSDIIALAGLSDDDDDKAISKKLMDTVKARAYLQVNIDETTPQTKTVVKDEDVSIFDE